MRRVELILNILGDCIPKKMDLTVTMYSYPTLCTEKFVTSQIPIPTSRYIKSYFNLHLRSINDHWM